MALLPNLGSVEWPPSGGLFHAPERIFMTFAVFGADS
jgi:hypothetical protein